MAPMD